MKSCISILKKQSNFINRGSYMSAHVLLNLLNESRKKDKMQCFAKHFITFSQKVKCNSIMHEYKC